MNPETTQPRPFPSPSATPMEVPVFRVRTAPGIPEPAPQVTPQCEPEVTHAILGAMDRLEDLLGVPGTPIQVAPAPVASDRPPAPRLDLPAPEAARRARRFTWFLPALAVGLSLGALQGKAGTRAHAEVRTFGAYPVPSLAPGLEPYLLRAEAGDPVAMRMLAFCLREGVDTPRNPAEAARWELKAALAVP